MRDRFVELLKQNNLSLTSTRIAVLETLEQHPHSDASHLFKMIQDKIPSASIQAVYNNLNALVESGLIREIKPKGQTSLYETRVDDNHHHLVCKKCNLVIDTDCQSESICAKPEDNKGFSIDETEIIFWGICSKCQKNQKEIIKQGEKDE